MWLNLVSLILTFQLHLKDRVDHHSSLKFLSIHVTQRLLQNRNSKFMGLEESPGSAGPGQYLEKDPLAASSALHIVQIWGTETGNKTLKWKPPLSMVVLFLMY